MKIQLTRGCIAGSLTIDGKEEIHLTDEERQDVLRHIFNHLKPLVEQMKHIHDMAVVAYTPLVNDLCNKNATQNEVEWMLDWLLMYAGDD